MRASQKTPALFLLTFAAMIAIGAIGGAHPALGFTLGSQYGAYASSATGVDINGIYNSVTDPLSGQGDGLTSASTTETASGSGSTATSSSSVNTVVHSITSSASAYCPNSSGCIDNSGGYYGVGGSTGGYEYDTYTLTCASCSYIDISVAYSISGSFLALDNGPVCQQGSPPGSISAVACRSAVDPEILLGNAPICQGYQGAHWYIDGCPQAVIDYQQGWNFCQGGGDPLYYCPSTTSFSLTGTVDLSQVMEDQGASFTSANPSPGTSVQLQFILSAESDATLPGSESVSGTATFSVTSTTPGVTITSAASGSSITTPPGASTTIVQLGSSSDAVGTPVTVTGSAYSAVSSGVIPTGTLSWSSSGYGTFSPTTCTISINRCSVTYTPTSSAGSPVTISASYGGDASDVPSSGSSKLTVTGPSQVPTTTGVSCLPSSISTSSSSSSTCTATVSGGSTPTGTVLFSSSSATGSFSPSTSCSLVSGICSVTYEDSTAGSPTITGTYSGDSGHFGSSGSSSVSVSSASSLSLTSSSGEAGSTTTLSGTGYATGLPYGACLDPSATDILSCIAASAVPFTPTAGGAVPSGVVLTVPAGTTPGQYYVTVATNGNIVVSSAPFTVVPTPITLSLASSSGEAGSTTTVSGSGYTDGINYEACLNPTATQVLCILGSDASFTSSGGAIPSGVVVTVPYGTSPGSYYVTVVAESGTDAVVSSAPFTVLLNSETLSLTPSSAQTGSTTTVSGTGYFPGVNYVACLGPSATDISSCISASAVPFTPTAGGAIPSGVVVTIPYGTPAGPYYVLAVVQYGPTLVSSAPFTVVPTPITLSLTSSSGQALSTTTLGGSGYSPSITYAACLNPSSSQSSCITGSVVTFTPTAVGVIPSGVVITVPAGTAAGPYYVTVVDSGTLAVVSSASFTVISPPPITLSLTSSSGEAGSTTTASGTGYTSGVNYVACLNPSATDISSCIDASAVLFTPTTGGAIPSGVVITIPSGQAPGTYYITVISQSATLVSSAPFTVVALPPSIVLSPSSGYVGQAFTVTGSAFSPGEGITVTFGGTSLGVTTASSTGAWTLPADVIFGSTVGPATVTATGSTTDSASATFTVVTAPTLGLTPNSGGPGSTFSATGANFPAGSTVSITFAYGASPSVTVGSALVDSTGAFTATNLIVPSGATGGFATVQATVQSVSPEVAAAAEFGVTASISIVPSSGFDDSLLTISGSAFAPGEGITITWGGATYYSLSASSAGTFTLPGDVIGPVGAVTVKATGSTGDSASTAFTVTPSPTLTLTPNSGSPGSVFTASGSNFPAGSTVSITFATSSSTETVGSALVDSTGAFSATNLMVPTAATGGFATVQATAQGVSPFTAAAAGFDVTPSIVLSVSTGYVDTPFSLSGSGFVPGEAVSLTFQGTVFLSTVASPGGEVTAASDVLPGVALGADTVKASGSSGDVATATFTVLASPTLTLTPGYGGPGATFSASGANFPAGSTVSITFSPVSGPGYTLGSALVSSTGSFSAANLMVPVASPGGFATVQATAEGVTPFAAAAGGFDVVPSIVLSPSSGYSGQALTIYGYAFVPGESVSVTFGTTSFGITVASGTGTFTFPGDVVGSTPGPVTVKADGSTGDAASATFTITAAPTLSLSPSSGGPGSTFSASGSNYPAGTTVSITFDYGVSSGATIGSAAVDSSGSFTATNLIVPSAAPGGFATVQATVQGVSPEVAAATGFDVTPALVLSPSTGFSPQPLTISGYAFSPGESITIKFGTISFGTVAADSSGAFTLPGDVPGGSPVGIVTVKATGSTGDSASTTFTVTASPTLALTPSSGGPGSVFTASGSNFPAGATVSITFSPASGPGSTIGSALVGSAGSFSATNLIVPTSVPGGFATVQATVQGVSPEVAAAAGFGVTPSIVLSPSTGAVDSFFFVQGSSFVPGENVDIYFGSAMLASDIASPTGSFNAQINVPSHSPGPVTVKASGVSGDSVSATFTVTPAPSIVVSPTFGAPGSVFSVTGNNFPAGGTVTITFATSSSSLIIGSVFVQPSGSFTLGSLVVPAIVPAGFATVQATDGAAAAAAEFDVVPSGPVSCTTSGNNLDVSVSGGSSTDSLLVTTLGGDWAISFDGNPVCTGYSDSGATGFSSIVVMESPSPLVPTTFQPGSDTGVSFFGPAGAQNSLDLSSEVTPASVSMNADTTSNPGTLSVVGGVSDSFSDITTVIASPAGSTDFKPGTATGVSFVGAGVVGNSILDLSTETGGTTPFIVSMNGDSSSSQGTVIGGVLSDTFAGVNLLVGSPEGVILQPGSASGVSFQGVPGATNTLDLSGETSHFTVSMMADSTSGPGSLNGGSTVDLFSGVTEVIGSQGGTDFQPGTATGVYFDGQNSLALNVLDLAPETASSFSSLSVSMGGDSPANTGTLNGGSLTDTFSGIGSVTGSLAVPTTFQPGSTSGVDFIGGPSVSNTLDLSAETAHLVVSTGGDSASSPGTVSGGTLTDAFSGITIFIGTSGGTTFQPGSTVGLHFVGGLIGSGTIDLSGTPAGPVINIAGGTLTLGGTTGSDTFSNIQNFIGSSAGSTTFKPDPSHSYTLTGLGSGNTLDLSGTPAGPVINIAGGTLTLGSVSDAIADIQTFVGSSAGGNTFQAPSSGGYILLGEGSSNTLDVLGAPTSAKIVLNGGSPQFSGNVVGLTGGSSDAFVDIQVFQGVLPSPVVTGVSPNQGPEASDTLVTITGSSFVSPAQVYFGATPAVSVTVVNSGTITASPPPGFPGAVDVTVSTHFGTSTTSAADLFTYLAPPVVTGVSPTSGPAGGGTLVTITGNFFASPASVSFGTTPSPSVHVVGAGAITAVSPAHSAGTVDITVTTAGGVSALSAADRFTFKASPTINTVVSNSGAITIGGSASDKGTFSGGLGTLTGSLTFYAYSSSSCSGSPSFTSSAVAVSGNGPYASGAFTPSSIGTYYWQVVFTDTDGSNYGFTSPCGGTGETLTVSYVTGCSVPNNGAGANLEGCNLSGVNLSGDNLKGANLAYADLQNTNLKGANLQGANLDYANAPGANFQGANLQSATLTNAVITGDNFQGVNLQSANLSGDSASGANFQGSNLQSANLSGGDFDHVNFQGANLHNSNMSNGDFNYANFQGANTQGANITGATFVGATNPP